MESNTMPIFDNCEDMLDIKVSEAHVEQVIKELSGSAGASGLDTISVSTWLLKFGGASKMLRKAIVTLVEYLSNGYPSWASYMVMIYYK